MVHVETVIISQISTCYVSNSMAILGRIQMKETTQIPVKIQNCGVVYKDRNQTVDKVIATFDGFQKKFLVSRTGQRGALVVVRGEDILLVKQYRLLINGISYEIPGGKIEEGENPMQAALRETAEETGVFCANAENLIEYHCSLDTLDNYTYIFVSEEIEKIETVNKDAYVWVNFKKTLNMIDNGSIIDSMSILALFAYQSRLMKKNNII